MFPCHDCPQQYIGETSKKVETRLTEHRNAIKRHDAISLLASHADDYEHSFNWSQTEILGQVATRHARKFKEAWHSMDRSTFNRHSDIPIIYHQLKQTQNPRLSSLSLTTGTHRTNIRNTTTTRKLTTGTFPTTTNINTQSESTNDNNPVNHQPIRHSKRLESQRCMSELGIKTPDAL